MVALPRDRHLVIFDRSIFEQELRGLVSRQAGLVLQ